MKPTNMLTFTTSKIQIMQFTLYSFNQPSISIKDNYSVSSGPSLTIFESRC